MRKYAVALVFLLVVSGCGGSSDTATPVTTATVVPTTTIQADTTVLATTTDTPTTTVPVATTDAPTTTSTSQVGLAAVCTFDESVPKISCQAVGVTQGSQLRWESNVWGWNTEPSYEIPLEQEYQSD